MFQKSDDGRIEHVSVRFSLRDMSLCLERFRGSFGIIYNEVYCLLTRGHKGGKLCELFTKEGFR